MCDIHLFSCLSSPTGPMISSSEKSASGNQSKKSVSRKGKKCLFVRDDKSSELVVAGDETVTQIKDLITDFVTHLDLPKDEMEETDTAKSTKEERVERRDGDECFGRREKGSKKGDKNSRSRNEMMQKVKQEFVLGVNEIVKSITGSRVKALLLTHPLQTHLQLQLHQMALEHNIPVVCVPGLNQTLTSLHIPSSIGLAIRSQVTGSQSVGDQILLLVQSVVPSPESGLGSKPSCSSFPDVHNERFISKRKYAFHFNPLQKPYSDRDLLLKSIRDETSAPTISECNESIVETVQQEESFFPIRDPLTFSSFVVDGITDVPSSIHCVKDRENDSLTRLSFRGGSNMDQSSASSSSVHTNRLCDDEEEMQVKYRPAESVILSQPAAGSKRRIECSTNPCTEKKQKKKEKKRQK